MHQFFFFCLYISFLLSFLDESHKGGTSPASFWGKGKAAADLPLMGFRSSFLAPLSAPPPAISIRRISPYSLLPQSRRDAQILRAGSNAQST